MTKTRHISEINWNDLNCSGVSCEDCPLSQGEFEPEVCLMSRIMSSQPPATCESCGQPLPKTRTD